MNGSLSRRLLFGLASSQRFEQAVRRFPGLYGHAARAARRYVAGTRREHAFAVVAQLDAAGMAGSIDLLGEHVRDAAEAERVTGEYVELAKLLRDLPERTWLALDLSHVGLGLSADFCRRQVARIVEALPMGRWLQIGAEDSDRTDATLDVVTALADESAALTMTLQANLRRTPADAERLAEAEVPIRLVKGAYVEHPSLAHPWGEATDHAFAQLAHQLRAGGARFSLATHDPLLREALLAAFGPVEVEMLLGVRSPDARELVARGIPVRRYVPFGRDWFRYWMRRVAESRGA
ncbi:MAG: proline dehydrogenase [Nitriliruptorales bacterium]|nr:proline dehydrogenase [Nitriliruptorales bacterium]